MSEEKKLPKFFSEGWYKLGEGYYICNEPIILDRTIVIEGSKEVISKKVIKKCFLCDKEIDLENESWVAIDERYYHYDCWKKVEEVLRDERYEIHSRVSKRK